MPTTPWPDLSVLELLTAVGATGSLGAAAREVGMAQPNASRAIRRLERDLGLTLLHRATTGSRLTSAGTVVAGLARGVLDPAHELLLGAATLRDGSASKLSIGASRTVAEYGLPAWLSLFRSSHPDVAVTVAVENSTEVFHRVTEGRCDVGFVESPRVPRGLRTTVVGVDELFLVVPPDHPWARRRAPLPLAELAATPLVCREPGSGTRRTLDDVLATYDPVPPALVLSSNEAVRISVISGAGPAVLSELAVAGSLASGQLVSVPIAGAPLSRRLRAVWDGPKVLTGPAGDLVGLARGIRRMGGSRRPPGRPRAQPR